MNRHSEPTDEAWNEAFFNRCVLGSCGKHDGKGNVFEMKYFMDKDESDLIVTRADALEAQAHIDKRREITDKHVEAYLKSFVKTIERGDGIFMHRDAVKDGLAAVMKSILNC